LTIQIYGDGLRQQASRFILVSGASQGYTMLNAFDGALINAGVGDINLVKLSSILPPFCTQREISELLPGALYPVAYSSFKYDIQDVIIASAVAIGIPLDPSRAGVIMEYSSHDTKEWCEHKVKEMVKEAMKLRKREIKEILCISAEIIVERCAATFAGVVLL
jgi:arginine decarboxylase